MRCMTHTSQVQSHRRYPQLWVMHHFFWGASTMYNVISRKAIRNKRTRTQSTIKEGTDLTITFDTEHPHIATISWLDAHGDIHKGNFKCERLHEWVSGMRNKPQSKTIDRWMSTGKAYTLTGHRCEPDGFGSDCSPSWILVLGIL